MPPSTQQLRGADFDRTLPGTGLRPEDEAIQGTRFTVGLDDPIWDAIAGLATLDYGFAGLGQRDLPLTGSAGPTRQFISESGALPPMPLQ
ncbi:MAG: hypothetical protein AB7O56_13275 [Bauldia sp.]